MARWPLSGQVEHLVRARDDVSSALVVKLLDAETHRRADAQAALAGGPGPTVR